MLNKQKLDDKLRADIKLYIAEYITELYKTDSNRHRKSSQLYNEFIALAEQCIFLTSLEICQYNQSKVSRFLGINLLTLRRRLELYFGDEFIGSRDPDTYIQ